MLDDYFELSQVFVGREIEYLLKKLQGQVKNGKLRRRLINAYRKKGDLSNAQKHLAILSKQAKNYNQYFRALNSIISDDKDCFFKRGMGPVPYKHFNNVFDQKFTASLLKDVEKRRHEFVASEIYSKNGGRVNKGFRDSELLPKKAIDKQMKKMFLQKISCLYEESKAFFNLTEARLLADELELNVYHKGVGFKRHTDKGVEEGVKTREITFIYYFYQEPKVFVGGDLALFDSNRRSGVCGEDFTRINIQNNSLIFFPSDCWHQVTALKSTGQDILSGRFTLNGWFHTQVEAGI